MKTGYFFFKKSEMSYIWVQQLRLNVLKQWATFQIFDVELDP